MTVIIKTDTDVELGKASGYAVSGDQGLPGFLQTHGGAQISYSPTLDVTITLDDFTSPAGSPLASLNTQQKDLEMKMKDMQIVIAALVTMMGGSVMLSTYELAKANAMTIHSEKLLDPYMLKVSVEG